MYSCYTKGPGQGGWLCTSDLLSPKQVLCYLSYSLEPPGFFRVKPLETTKTAIGPGTKSRTWPSRSQAVGATETLYPVEPSTGFEPANNRFRRPMPSPFGHEGKGACFSQELSPTNLPAAGLRRCGAQREDRTPITRLRDEYVTIYIIWALEPAVGIGPTIFSLPRRCLTVWPRRQTRVPFSGLQPTSFGGATDRT